MDEAYHNALASVLEGPEVESRIGPTKEIFQHTVSVDMRRPVLLNKSRKISKKFMAAEAYWILSGDNTVAGICPWNKNMLEYSDDGIYFGGAYGPPVVDQLPYVIRTLEKDGGSRQAGLTIWRPKPGHSKDVACTISTFFMIRWNRLYQFVTMRSSDVWLGLPYDIFTFSMLGHLVCGYLNMRRSPQLPLIEPGLIFNTAASRHLYESQWDKGVQARVCPIEQQHPTSEAMFISPTFLMEKLVELRDDLKGNWWRRAQT